MPDQRPDRRRTPARGPRRGETRDAGRTRGRSTSGAAKPASAGTSRATSTSTRPPRGAASASGTTAHRPRLTGRAGVLVLVVALLAVSYASSLRAYLQQRHQIQGLQSEIDHRQASIDALSAQKKQWNDKAYVEQRARELGYVMPGETPYVVMQGGKPLSTGGTLDSPSILDHSTPTAWWSTAWASDQVAGHPPTTSDPVPLTKVPAPSTSSSSSSSSSGN